MKEETPKNESNLAESVTDAISEWEKQILHDIHVICGDQADTGIVLNILAMLTVRLVDDIDELTGRSHDIKGAFMRRYQSALDAIGSAPKEKEENDCQTNKSNQL